MRTDEVVGTHVSEIVPSSDFEQDPRYQCPNREVLAPHQCQLRKRCQRRSAPTECERKPQPQKSKRSGPAAASRSSVKEREPPPTNQGVLSGAANRRRQWQPEEPEESQLRDTRLRPSLAIEGQERRRWCSSSPISDKLEHALQGRYRPRTPRHQLIGLILGEMSSA